MLIFVCMFSSIPVIAFVSIKIGIPTIYFIKAPMISDPSNGKINCGNNPSTHFGTFTTFKSHTEKISY